MVSIPSKNMSKLRRILIRNLSGGYTEVSTEVPPTKTKIIFYRTTFFKVFMWILILSGCGYFISWIITLINNKETTQETEPEINEEITVTTEYTRNPDDNRETITIDVSESRTTRSSGNRRNSNTQRTENIESTRSVQERSCVNGVCS